MVRLWPGDERNALLAAGEQTIPRDGWWTIPGAASSLWLIAGDDVIPHLSQGGRAGEVDPALASRLNQFLAGRLTSEVRPGWNTPIAIADDATSVRLWLPSRG